MKALKRWEKQPSDNSTTLWHHFFFFSNNKRQSIQTGNTCIWPTLCNHRIFLKFHCVAVLPYHWSSWTVYVQQWDWLKGSLLLGTNYDRAWFYDLSLQHPPTLWARSEGSSISIVDLHCTWGQIHTTEKFKKLKKK